MGILSFDRIHEGRSSETSADGRKVIRRFTDIYRAVTDDPHTEPEDVEAYALCPRVGQAHPRDPRAFCRRVKPDNEGFSKLVYLVTCDYSTEREMREDPTAEPTRWRWRTQGFERPVVYDRNGVGHTNAAGDPFDPPSMDDDCWWTLIGTKNLAAIPTWVLECRNTVNDADVQIDGVDVPKGWARMANLEIGEPQERNEVAFRVLTMTLEVGYMDDTTNMYKWNGSSYTALGASEFEHVHSKIDLNAGLYCLSAGDKVACTDDNGEEAKIPMLLAADGTQISLPADPSDATFIVSPTKREFDYTLLPLV